MRPLLRPLPLTLPRLLRRLYSSQSTPLINITDVPATSSGRIRILSLARPAARNAISRQLLWELRSHIDSIASEYDAGGEEVPKFGASAGVDQTTPTRALIVASEVDSCFCAGADLKERAGFTAEEYAIFLFSLNLLLLELEIYNLMWNLWLILSW
jgi:methylglutaconyl-CoA hydratase